MLENASVIGPTHTKYASVQLPFSLSTGAPPSPKRRPWQSRKLYMRRLTRWGSFCASTNAQEGLLRGASACSPRAHGSTLRGAKYLARNQTSCLLVLRLRPMAGQRTFETISTKRSTPSARAD